MNIKLSNILQLFLNQHNLEIRIAHVERSDVSRFAFGISTGIIPPARRHRNPILYRSTLAFDSQEAVIGAVHEVLTQVCLIRADITQSPTGLIARYLKPHTHLLNPAQFLHSEHIEYLLNQLRQHNTARTMEMFATDT